MSDRVGGGRKRVPDLSIAPGKDAPTMGMECPLGDSEQKFIR